MYDQFVVFFTHTLFSDRFCFKTAHSVKLLSQSTLTYLRNPVRFNRYNPPHRASAYSIFFFLPLMPGKKQAVDVCHRLFILPSSIGSLP